MTTNITAIARLLASGDATDALTPDVLLRYIAQQADQIDALQAALDAANQPAPDLLPVSYWVDRFPQDYAKTPTYETFSNAYTVNGVYWVGYVVRAMTMIAQLGGDAVWIDKAWEQSQRAFATIRSGADADRSSLIDMLFLRGLCLLIDHLPGEDARRAALIDQAGAVWDFHWPRGAGGIKRVITHILWDNLIVAMTLRKYDDSRAAQYAELIDWATAKLEGAYNRAVDGVWIMGLDGKTYQEPPDTAHAGRDAMGIVEAIALGYDNWARYLPLMQEAFWHVYNPDTHLFSRQLDGTGTPEANNFAFIWAPLGSTDPAIQKALEDYQGTYMALFEAQMGWNVRGG